LLKTGAGAVHPAEQVILLAEQYAQGDVSGGQFRRVLEGAVGLVKFQFPGGGQTEFKPQFF
jgi:hypothetical protein